MISIDGEYQNNLRQLISLVDELRDVGLERYIQLPRICVVGTQSAGKSSILESVVGVDFLPRGEGVVTRRPLELRLVHDESKENDKPWAVFDDNRHVVMYDFNEVTAEIERRTESIAGRNKGIVDDPIVLTIYSKHCPNLSLIDLPGITRVPTRGSDQTNDIETLTRQMAQKYAQDAKTVILAVMPANQDLSTSDALQLARKVDPKGLRTVGVITKIDLMDSGTDASKMLIGEDIPLRLGYIGIKGRSQADIINQVSIEEGLENERQYFMNHPIYQKLKPELLGTSSLSEKLTKIFFQHIRFFLPEIKTEIQQRTISIEDRLKELGDGVPTDLSNQVQLIWRLTTDFTELFTNSIRGKYDRKLQKYLENQEINAGCQIRHHFNELLSEYSENGCTNHMSDRDIEKAIRLHEGDSLPGFPSPDTFEYLLLPYLRKIRSPVIDCLDSVHQTLESLIQQVSNCVFARFPILSSKVLDLTERIILREKGQTRSILDRYISAETGYLFTNDQSYISSHGSLLSNKTSVTEVVSSNNDQPIKKTELSLSKLTAPIPEQKKKKEPINRYSESFIMEIRNRIDAYFSIVVRNVRDTVPKMLGCFFIRSVLEQMQFEVYNTLNKQESLEELLGEHTQVSKEREKLISQLKTLNNSNNLLRSPNVGMPSYDDIFDEAYESDMRQQHSSNFNQNPSNNTQKDTFTGAGSGVSGGISGMPGGISGVSPGGISGVSPGGISGVSSGAVFGGVSSGAVSGGNRAANLWSTDSSDVSHISFDKSIVTASKSSKWMKKNI
eukprot:GHVL01020798.1.p1 GENE.GHVL01020798.1~~GHVL01020798.1.p1  ORF type:complete len:796 (-),score=145.90 GHVL01020798.1:39-2390(-)